MKWATVGVKNTWLKERYMGHLPPDMKFDQKLFAIHSTPSWTMMKASQEDEKEGHTCAIYPPGPSLVSILNSTKRYWSLRWFAWVDAITSF